MCNQEIDAVFHSAETAITVFLQRLTACLQQYERSIEDTHAFPEKTRQGMIGAAKASLALCVRVSDSGPELRSIQGQPAPGDREILDLLNCLNKQDGDGLVRMLNEIRLRM